MSNTLRPARRLPVAGALSMAAVLAASLVVPAAALATGSPPVPVADAISTTEDHAPVTGNVLANDTDPETDPLTVTSAGAATLGTLVVETNGDYTFTPAANANGAETVAYHVSDGSNEPVAGEIDITLTAVPDAPVAVDDAVTGVEDTVLFMNGLLDNDHDADGNTLGINWLTNQSGGTFSWLSSTSIKFTPPKDVCGAAVASVDYQVNDGTGRTDMGHVVISLTCTNDPPVAVDDVASAVKGGPAVDIDAAANDTDANGDALTVTEVGSVSPAEAGTVAVDGGHALFTPSASYLGAATFSYTVSDGELTDDGTVTVTVSEGADVTPPVVTSLGATFGTSRVDESIAVKVTWAATDPSGIAGYQVQASVAGGAWSTIYTGMSTSATKSFPFGKAITFRVHATDGAPGANTSGWTEITRTALAFQAPGTKSIKYSSGWTTTINSRHSGVGARYTSTRGRYASLTFNGREVVYVAPRRSSAGYVKVYVDGVYQGRYSLYSSTNKWGQVIFRKTFAYGLHTIKIVNDSSGRRAYLDAFVVMR